MIGVGYVTRHNKWRFEYFAVDTFSDQEEKRICDEFISYINRLKLKYGINNPLLWHWSSAEPNVWSNILLKYNLKVELNWADLLKVVMAGPLVIKGCFNFKLKSIAYALYKQKAIFTIWDDLDDGITAMIKMVQGKMNEVIKYNEVDVKVLQEILYYLRQHNKRKGDKDEPIHKRRRVK